MEQRLQGSQLRMAVPVEVLDDLVLDLRTALVATIGFLTLLERAESEPSAKRYAACLRESVESMRKVVDRARAISYEAEVQ